MPKTPKPRLPRIDVSKSRLEFLFDGIFAIAMTILVLELKVPELSDRHSTTELFRSLAHHGATFFSYLFSFAMLGILWYNHQRQYRFIRRVGTSILASNLVLMATAASFPFCAALFGRYPTNAGTQLVYASCLLIHIGASTLQWRLAEKQGCLDPDMDPVLAVAIRKRNIRGLLVLTILFVSYLVRVIL